MALDDILAISLRQLHCTTDLQGISTEHLKSLCGVTTISYKTLKKHLTRLANAENKMSAHLAAKGLEQQQ